MRYPKVTVARGGIVSVVSLLLATSLGGCIAYTNYPSQDYSYRYSYPHSYYTDYPRAYAYSYNYHPYYSSDYNSYYNTYENSGGGNR
jgi:hypothetical protein